MDAFRRQGRFRLNGPRFRNEELDPVSANREHHNLYTDLPSLLPEELIEVLAESRHVRVERIVSTGQSSPEGFWYDQEETEWVCVLMGEATLSFADDDQPLHLEPGDHVTIPAHRKHRVESTSPDEPTVWLAVFWSSP